MQIVFTTFNARYSHTALALRCLRANMGDLHDCSEIVEFDNSISPQTAAESLLARNPETILFSVYIWNLVITYETLLIIKNIRPDIKTVVGGPEVSYEYEDSLTVQTADHLIRGEGETVIEQVCRTLLQHTVPQASSLPSFNPLHEITQSQRKNLPHWTQKNCTYFVTFRLADSIAQSRIKEYCELREKWQEYHQPPYTGKEQQQFDQLFSDRVNNWLDEGAGSCILRDPEISKIVADVLQHFDKKRYLLDEWVIMPNHVHVLVAPLPGFELKSILHSWKSFSAQQINRHIGKSGTIWKQESYDHIVRNHDELTRIREYIRNNPVKAGITARQSRLEACDTVPQASSLQKVIDAPAADLNTVALPYEEYTAEDIAHRRIYVESTRGCPFSCDYCLSSLETGIRIVPDERLFPMFGKLIERGARIFKFIDRSFNACPDHAAAVLRFFLKNRCDGMMLHLEWEPHLLPEKLEQILREAPIGFFQLEAGVQTFTPEVAKRINRKLETETVEKNIRLLSTLPSVHLHADLIAGLPGETMISLSESFDRLHACGPHEIQLGILKKLRGAPIAQHDQEFEMTYNTAPPYDVLQTSTMSFPELQAVRRFARFWDITVNNGRFLNSAPMIWENRPSVFGAFMEWSNWLYEQTHAIFGFTPARLGRLLIQFLTEQRCFATEDAARIVEKDLSSSSSAVKGMERQARRKQ